MSTILIIDDDPTMRQITSDVLELSGFTVIEAENGKAGVELAKKSEVDLIICDVEMPELDGYGVQKIINAEPNLINTPFIFLSGKDKVADIRKGMDLGADDYLVKPLSKTDLLNAVDSRLAKAEKFKNYQISLFKNNSLSNESFKTLFDLTDGENSVSFRKTDVIYREGEEPHSLYFIKSGRVKISKNNLEGKEFVSNIMGSGSFIGHHAILEKTTYHEDAFALDDSVLIYVPIQKINAILKVDPSVAVDLAKLLNKKLEESEERLVSMAYDSVRKRTADVLIRLEEKFKNHDHEEKVEIKITRDDLAALVGTASETVIRVLRDFKDGKILEVKGRTIQILDIEKLKDQNY